MCLGRHSLAVTCFSTFSSYLVNTELESRGSYYIVASLEVAQGIPLRTKMLLPLMPGAWKLLLLALEWESSVQSREVAYWILLNNGSTWVAASLGFVFPSQLHVCVMDARLDGMPAHHRCNYISEQASSF